MRDRSPLQLLQLALVLLSGFFVTELIGAGWSHSLSLLADAGHVLSDMAALGVTLTAMVIQQRDTPQSRVKAIAACINGLSLLLVAGWIGWEALDRLQSPDPEIQGWPMLLVAIAGLGINSFNALWLRSCSCHDLNWRGAFLHILADIASSLGTILAAIAVAWLHWSWADGAISLIVAVIIIFLALPLLIQSLQALQTRSPQPLTPTQRQELEKVLYPSLNKLIN
ncbi:MAG: cation diffusion facilitator family transporter [Jaaginema sp. PMC 1079.18]|nr:cation diffusion facilitator family transporter [Jaaginema sp. PMC 1080.18]MEC4853518.1 cation diffusion facilitator family transporter [Jaaginema sp. PMC 1079.18]